MKRKTGFSGSSAIPYLAVLLVVLLVLATVAFVHVSETDRHNDEYVLRVTEQRVIAEQLGKNILAASQGDEAAFVSLLENRDRYDTLMKELKTGAPDAGLPPVPAGVSGLVREMENTWLALRQDADEVLAAQDQLIAVRGQIDVVADVTPQLQELSEQVDAAADLVSRVLGLRKKHQVRVRQPLASVTVAAKSPKMAEAFKRFEDHILDELNVKALVLEVDESRIVNYSIGLNMSVAGPKYGRAARAIAAALESADAMSIAMRTLEGQQYT